MFLDDLLNRSEVVVRDGQGCFRKSAELKRIRIPNVAKPEPAFATIIAMAVIAPSNFRILSRFVKPRAHESRHTASVRTDEADLFHRWEGIVDHSASRIPARSCAK